MSIPTLIGHQTEILYVADNQNMVITGSAGCGKSLLAIYRIYWLSKVYPNDKIVLLTFNKAVNIDMKRKIEEIAENRNEQVPKNLIVATYNRLMLQILKKICDSFSDTTLNVDKYISGNKVVDYNNEKKEQIKKAVDEVSEQYTDESTFKRPYETFLSEISWMQQMSVMELDTYEKMERVGRRGTRIDRSKRKYFFEVFEHYIKIREEKGYYYDFEDIGTIIRDLLKEIKDKDKKKKLLSFRYILIDEFQDFSSDMLMTVNELSDHNGAMVLLGDINQGVFGKRISFKSLGININSFKKYKLIQNYRNSLPISQFAEKISQSPYFDKNNEFYAESKLGVRKGQDPEIIQCQDEEEEMIKVYQYITDVKKQNRNEKVGIIIPGHKFKDFKQFLLNNNDSIEKYELKYSNNNIVFGAYRQIKGLEFDTVIMPFLSKKVFKECIQEDNKEINFENDNVDLSEIDSEILEMYISQYYVGVTRAREKLFLFYSGELTPLLERETFSKYCSGGGKS
ncbi:hypothetical protein BU019_12655 [Staphylococcus simulans]|uniref:UvrD-helicase domain-containing protein n=1 Tax=Staphylococcus simulans TaxID=1286 RepID=UPI000D1F9FE3|nr:UvrD-helicase domain-containing protein [Staphylococcus simulans]PTI97782.1 hypothetical protein BU054_05630 [Staphylococcus simulans]PTJ49584.1 hypothetical protein BU019_12655 [Staphylococcus simulans]